jgi:PadR family transcriptional regulator, regulatory protein PadR
VLFVVPVEKPFDIANRYRISISAPMAKRTELLKGTLDLLILKTLDLEGRHGLGVAERIEQITRGAFSVKPGSLFPALHRLEEYGFITGEWTASDAGRRVKAYRLTAAGRKQLAAEKRQWARIALAVTQILEST